MRCLAFLPLLLFPLAAGQYKYVFYDGDEAEYEDFNQTDPERVEVEVNEEDYGGYYDYDYTKDRNTEDEVEEYSEDETPEEEEDYEENEDAEAREENRELQLARSCKWECASFLGGNCCKCCLQVANVNHGNRGR